MQPQLAYTCRICRQAFVEAIPTRLQELIEPAQMVCRGCWNRDVRTHDAPPELSEGGATLVAFFGDIYEALFEYWVGPPTWKAALEVAEQERDNIPNPEEAEPWRIAAEYLATPPGMADWNLFAAYVTRDMPTSPDPNQQTGDGISVIGFGPPELVETLEQVFGKDNVFVLE